MKPHGFKRGAVFEHAAVDSCKSRTENNGFKIFAVRENIFACFGDGVGNRDVLKTAEPSEAAVAERCDPLAQDDFLKAVAALEGVGLNRSYRIGKFKGFKT